MEASLAGDAAEARGPSPKAARGLRLAPRALRYYRLWHRFRHDTMVGRDDYIANLYLADQALGRPSLAAGVVIECGTWRGGMAAGLASIGGPAREYHFFDSFAGLPPAGVEDGDYARRAQLSGELYFDNNSASLDEFTAVIARARVPPTRLHVHKGWFAETLPAARVPAIALLRLDGDWYSSTLECLEAFWDRLLPGALVLVDDYYAWEGCSKAVHAFLAARRAPETIRASRFGKVAYLLKR